MRANVEGGQLRGGKLLGRRGRLVGEESSQSKNILQPQKHLTKNSSLGTKRKNRALTVFPGRSAAIPAGHWGLFLLRGAGKRQGCRPVSSRTLPWMAAQQPNHHQIWAKTCTHDSEKNAEQLWNIVSSRDCVTLAKTRMGPWWALGDR